MLTTTNYSFHFQVYTHNNKSATEALELIRKNMQTIESVPAGGLELSGHKWGVPMFRHVLSQRGPLI